MKQSLYDNELQTLMMKRDTNSIKKQNQQIYMPNYQRPENPTSQFKNPKVQANYHQSHNFHQGNPELDMRERKREFEENDYYLTSQDRRDEYLGTNNQVFDTDLRDMERVRKEQQELFTQNEAFFKKFEGINRIIRNSVAKK